MKIRLAAKYLCFRIYSVIIRYAKIGDENMSSKSMQYDSIQEKKVDFPQNSHFGKKGFILKKSPLRMLKVFFILM